MNDELIPLVKLPHELRALTGDDPPPYRKLYHEIVSDRLPAEQVRGRWYVRREDLEAIAETVSA